jgi:hypothetical protein
MNKDSIRVSQIVLEAMKKTQQTSNSDSLTKSLVSLLELDLEDFVKVPPFVGLAVFRQYPD